MHYRQNKHVLFGQQEGRCNGCRSEFPFRVLQVDHNVPRGGGQDNIEDLQLLCAHCNRLKGDRPQEYLVARLRELGIAARLGGNGPPLEPVYDLWNRLS